MRPSAPDVLSVSALNGAIARMLERGFPLTWVTGEIANFTRAASGHWYFTLKDDAAQVRAVMFRSRAHHTDFVPREGDRVEVRAQVTLYAPRGDYQLNVESMRRAGAGNLYETFLQLKNKLQAEGLFDPVHKRPLPPFVRTIGIVTSLQAAALRDVLTTLARRAPHVQAVLYPTIVQGEGSALKIAQVINTASLRKECDVLLICRGGGGIEDLWAFNHEDVARAIYAASMPTITGIGHETDSTIADFAADIRAATPTAAAELATITRSDWLMQLQACSHHLQLAAKRQLEQATQTLDWASRHLIAPASRIKQEYARLVATQQRMQHATHTALDHVRFSLFHMAQRWQNCSPDTQSAQRHIERHAHNLAGSMQTQLRDGRQHLHALSAQLDMLNPQRTLARGYAIVSSEQGEILRTPRALVRNDNVVIRLAQGSAKVSISNVQPLVDTSKTRQKKPVR